MKMAHMYIPRSSLLNKGCKEHKLSGKSNQCMVGAGFPNIPSAPAYREYISQLIRHSRACGSYQDFLDRKLLLTRKLRKY